MQCLVRFIWNKNGKNEEKRDTNGRRWGGQNRGKWGDKLRTNEEQTGKKSGTIGDKRDGGQTPKREINVGKRSKQSS